MRGAVGFATNGKISRVYARIVSLPPNLEDMQGYGVGKQCSCHAMQVDLISKSTRDGHDWCGRAMPFAPSGQPIMLSANAVGL